MVGIFVVAVCVVVVLAVVVDDGARVANGVDANHDYDGG